MQALAAFLMASTLTLLIFLFLVAADERASTSACAT